MRAFVLRSAGAALLGLHCELAYEHEHPLLMVLALVLGIRLYADAR